MPSKGNEVTVRIQGLKEFQAALRAADRELPKEIKRALDVIANRILLPVILAKMEAAFVLPLGDKKDHRHRSGKLLKSVRAVSQQRAGIIKEGIASTPYAGWFEFGGSTHSSRGNPDREFIHEGRTLYPALHETRHLVAAEADKVMDNLRHVLESHSV